METLAFRRSFIGLQNQPILFSGNCASTLLVASDFDDVLLSRAFTGLETNMLRPSIIAAGLNPSKIPAEVGQEGATVLYSGSSPGPRRWKDIWSAGHAVSGVDSISGVDELIEQTRREYEIARQASREASF